MSSYKRIRGQRVWPKSYREIQSIANDFRKDCGSPSEPADLALLVEYMIDGDMFYILEDDDPFLSNEYAKTVPESHKIYVRNSVYCGMVDGVSRDRFTIAHEIGHAVLHGGQSHFARTDREHKIYEDAEWQADVFAANFLIGDHEQSKHLSATELSTKYAISAGAAKQWLKKQK